MVVLGSNGSDRTTSTPQGAVVAGRPIPQCFRPVPGSLAQHPSQAQEMSSSRSAPGLAAQVSAAARSCPQPLRPARTPGGSSGTSPVPGPESAPWGVDPVDEGVVVRVAGPATP